MDTYQAIYDAVRSRLTNANVGDAVAAAIRDANIGFHADMAKQAVFSAAAQYERPSVLFRPRLYLDGNMFCALYGEDLMNGCAGFGLTAAAAMDDFDTNWNRQQAPQPAKAEPR